MDREEEKYMRRAIELAGRGEGRTSPNPLVGAVIVKDGRIVGEGYHEVWGGPHAERNALAAVRDVREGRTREEAAGLLSGAVMYVTLEPCCHTGKTPPCTEAILEAGIGKVVIGSRDPNPRVAGRGAEILKKAGITVVQDFLREECDQLNPVFFHFITAETPYVALKYAMTADGKIAASSGQSKWITGEEARADVQRLRNKYSAIMAGIGTVLRDDPLLTCRMEGGRNPVRIICDSRLRIPEDSRICRTAGEIPTIVAAAVSGWNSWDRINSANGGSEIPGTAAASGAAEPWGACRSAWSHETDGGMNEGAAEKTHERVDEKANKKADERGAAQRASKKSRLEALGVTVLELPEAAGGVDLKALMRELGARNIDSVLLEGGGALNYSVLKEGLANKVYVYVAPKLFGGKTAKTPVEGAGVEYPDQAALLSDPRIHSFGSDLLLEYEVIRGMKDCLQES